MAWETRWHPLRQEWVTITGHRNLRPWQGDVVSAEAITAPVYDPSCYLCPGNTRISGELNDTYNGVFVFDNDHPAYGDSLEQPEKAPGIYANQPANGVTRVLCYSPQHNLTMANMSQDELLGLMRAWQKQTAELRQREDIQSVLIFENRGAAVGMSNPHPHCQVFAAPFVFNTLAQEARSQADYDGQSKDKSSLMAAMLASEEQDGRRIINQSDSMLAFVPYCARWPYETWIVPKTHYQFIDQLDQNSLAALAVSLQDVLVRYRDLWPVDFPYILMLHQAPCQPGDLQDNFHFHIQLYPPLRQPGLIKMLGGVETGGGTFLNDRAPEQAAQELQAVC